MPGFAFLQNEEPNRNAHNLGARQLGPSAAASPPSLRGSKLTMSPPVSPRRQMRPTGASPIVGVPSTAVSPQSPPPRAQAPNSRAPVPPAAVRRTSLSPAAHPSPTAPVAAGSSPHHGTARPTAAAGTGAGGGPTTLGPASARPRILMPTAAALEQQGLTPNGTRLSTLPGMTPAQLNDRGFDSVRASRTAGRLTGRTAQSTSVGASPSPPSSAWMDAAWDETSPPVRWESPRPSAASNLTRPTLGGGAVQYPQHQQSLHQQSHHHHHNSYGLQQQQREPAVAALFQDADWTRLSARSTAQSAPVPVAAVLRASSRTGSTGRAFDEPRQMTCSGVLKRLVAFAFLAIVAYALATLAMDPAVRAAVLETLSQFTVLARRSATSDLASDGLVSWS